MRKKDENLCIFCKAKKALGKSGSCIDCYNKIKLEVMQERAAINHVDIPEKVRGKNWNGKLYKEVIYVDNEPIKLGIGEYVHFLTFSIAGTITSPRLPKLELVGDFPSHCTLNFNGETVEETIMTHPDWESQLFVWAKKIDEIWGVAKAYFSDSYVFLVGTKTPSPKYQLVAKDEKKIPSEQRELARQSLRTVFMNGALLEGELRSCDGPLTVFENTVEEEVKDIISSKMTFNS